MEDVSSKAPYRGSVAPLTAALQHSRSNAASEHDAALLHAHAHAQPMQVGQAVSLALCCLPWNTVVYCCKAAETVVKR